MTDANREEIAVALATSFRSSLIAPFSTPELRSAFEQLKEFVRVNVPAGEIEAHAFRLVGESQEAIDREARKLFEALRQQLSPPLKRSMAFGFAFMFRELVCERIRKIEGSGRGNA